jgi:hypothetical protein
MPVKNSKSYKVNNKKKNKKIHLTKKRITKKNKNKKKMIKPRQVGGFNSRKQTESVGLSGSAAFRRETQGGRAAPQVVTDNVDRALRGTEGEGNEDDESRGTEGEDNEEKNEEIKHRFMELTLEEVKYFSDTTSPWPEKRDFTPTLSEDDDDVLSDDDDDDGSRDDDRPRDSLIGKGKFAFNVDLKWFRVNTLVFKKIVYSLFFWVFTESQTLATRNPVEFLKVLKYLNKKKQPVPRSLFIRAIKFIHVSKWGKGEDARDVLRKLYEALVVTGVDSGNKLANELVDVLRELYEALVGTGVDSGNKLANELVAAKMKLYDCLTKDALQLYDSLTKDALLAPVDALGFIGLPSDLVILNGTVFLSDGTKDPRWQSNSDGERNFFHNESTDESIWEADWKSHSAVVTSNGDRIFFRNESTDEHESFWEAG